MEEKDKTNSKRPYDLEERTFLFAKEARDFVKMLPKTPGNMEDVRQLTRSSGSVGANYIEANEPVSRKDFLLRIKTCRKEAKESAYWLRLLDCVESAHSEGIRMQLRSDACELMNIFAAILRKNA